MIIDKVELEDLIKFSKTVRVLYVESDKDLRDNSLGVFKIFFHKIDTASDGIEGFKYFEKNKYDLIITSVNLPLMSGVDMITKIREISKHITILIKSSNTNNFIDLIRLGIDGYILKPVEINQFTVIIQKVIEKLQNKQELYEYKNLLEKKISEKTKSLEQLNNNLEEKVKQEVLKNQEQKIVIAEQSKMVALGEMIGNISHQWRQPLSTISTAASGIQLQKEYGILKDDHLIDSCESIVKNAEYLSQTIDDFRNFIKGDSAKTTFSLKSAIHSFISLVEGSITASNLNLVLDLNEDINIYSHKNELTQCLINIFNNAKDSFLEKETEYKYIFISISKENDQAIIKIKDNGDGIANDILPKIFEPYFTTKHKSQGTGLGLHMTYRLIVDGMNGTIKAHNTNFEHEDKIHNGAQITISIPIS